MTLARALATPFLLAVVLHARLGAASGAHPGVEASALGGYGASNEPNILGPGFGLRFGYRTRCRLYGGVIGLVHLGSHDEGEPEVRHHSQSLRFELGYEVGRGALGLRPSVRVGAARITTPRDVDRSFVSPDVGAGATLLLPISELLIGLDFDVQLYTRPVHNGDNLFSLASAAAYASVGYRF